MTKTRTKRPNLTLAGLSLLAMLVTLAALPGAASAAGPGGLDSWADGDHPGLERMHERRLERLTEMLELTDQQVEQWQQIHATYAESAPASREEMHALHERVRELASADDADATAVGELVIQAHKLREQQRAEREALHEELLSILTPDQQERFELMREMRPERGRHGRHGRGARDRGPRPGDA